MDTIMNAKLDPSRLRAIRGTRKQAHVAKEAGILRQSLNRYESGAATPPGDILARLLMIYGARVEDVVTTEQTFADCVNL